MLIKRTGTSVPEENFLKFIQLTMTPKVQKEPLVPSLNQTRNISLSVLKKFLLERMKILR